MGMLDGVIDPEVLRHRAPEAGRTQYLPVSGDGGIDGNGDATSVDELDKHVETINAATLDYVSEHLCSYDDEPGCEGDCTGAPAGVPDFAAPDAVAPVKQVFQSFMDVLGAVDGMLSNYSGEQLVDRLSTVYAGEGSTTFNTKVIGEQTQAVMEALVQALAASKKSGDDALAVNRLTVQALRNSLADRAEHRVNALTMMWMVPMGLNPVGLGLAGISAASTAYDLWKGGNAREASLESVKAAEPMLQEAAKANDAAIANLVAALEKWVVTPNGNAVPTPPKPAAPAENHGNNDDDDLDDTEPPLDSAPPATAAPLSGGGGGTTGGGSAPDPLEELFNESEPELPPSMSDPGMGGMPSSGMGSPLGGGMPSSGMGSPLGGGTSDPLAAEPLSDMLEDEDELDEEEPLDDLTEEDEDAEDDELFPEDETEEQGDIAADVEVPEADDTDTDEPVEETPENGDVPPVEGEPAAPKDDTAARTADVGNGRMVTFPSEKLAQVAAALGMEGNENKTLYMAASEAGYQLPPMGQDIGSQVPPGLLREGDIVVNGDNQMGVFLGSGDVLMEGGEIKPLSEVANFGGENQGLFRLEEAAPTDGLTAPAQPVGDGSAAPVGGDPAVVSTPGEVTEDVGTPGVPTDTKADDLSATDDTLAGLNMGETDNGDAGLDPSTAFPS